MIEVMHVVALNAEKLRALQAEGNVLVIANPGTGKTLLLAHKYVQLVKRGVKPEEILCLTYTNKATDAYWGWSWLPARPEEAGQGRGPHARLLEEHSHYKDPLQD